MDVVQLQISTSRAGVRRSIMLANFCGRCLVSWENRFYWQTKLANFIVRLTSALRSKLAVHTIVVAYYRGQRLWQHALIAAKTEVRLSPSII